MVEKVSEASISVAIAGDSTPDDNALLNRIEKKKKQKPGDESSALAGLVLQAAPTPLTAAFTLRGGVHSTDKQAVKEAMAAARDILETPQGDSLRRRVALAVANQWESRHSDKKFMTGHKIEAGDASRRNPAAEGAGSEKSAPVSVNARPAVHSDVGMKHPPFAPAEPSRAGVPLNPAGTAHSAREAVADRQKAHLRVKEDTGEVRPLWQVATPVEGRAPTPREAASHGKDSPATLQQLKTQASLASDVKGTSEEQRLEVKYQFQRWTGDHSVKISLPAEARRDGNVTLLPSDARAADVLLRNMGHLTGLNPDLLHPQQENDEQQERRHPQQQDEDQE